MLHTCLRFICGGVSALFLFYSVGRFLLEAAKEPNALFALAVLAYWLIKFLGRLCIENAKECDCSKNLIVAFNSLGEGLRFTLIHSGNFIWFLVDYISISYMADWVLASDPVHVYTLICTGAGLTLLPISLLHSDDIGGAVFIGYAMPYVLHGGYTWLEIIIVAGIPGVRHCILPFLQYIRSAQEAGSTDEILEPLLEEVKDKDILDLTEAKDTEISGLTKELKGKDEIIGKMQQQQELQNNAIKTKNELIQDLNAQIEEFWKRYNYILALKEAKDQEISGLTKELKGKDEIIGKMQRQQELQDKELFEKNQLIQDLNAQIEELRKRNNALDTDLKSKNESLQNLRSTSSSESETDISDSEFEDLAMREGGQARERRPVEAVEQSVPKDKQDENHQPESIAQRCEEVHVHDSSLSFPIRPSPLEYQTAPTFQSI